MPSNIEIKARASDLSRKHELASRVTGRPPTVLRQEDTFFPSREGRLKLRRLSDTEGELIFYTRPDLAGMKQSDYSIFSTSSPDTLHAVLTTALGIRMVVRKTRWLYLAGQTRIHLDEVEGLGTFVELEVVLGDGQSADDGREIARDMMTALEIDEGDLVHCAYADLLEPAGK